MTGGGRPDAGAPPLRSPVGGSIPWLPGVAIAAVTGMAATLISERYGGPAMLFALLLGMTLAPLSLESCCRPGIGIASKQILRLGVALLGARITAGQVAALGSGATATVVAGVVLTILFGWGAAHALRVDKRLGILTAGAVAICGASAALAIAAVLPKDDESERNTIFTVIGVTALSTAAMVLYPILVAVLGLSDTRAGIFLGASIHDVAQVVGAGFSISPEAGSAATVTKLFRVALLVPVVFALSLLFRGQTERTATPMPPGFLVAFVLLVAANSIGLVPDVVRTAASEASQWCLVTAIAALGMKTSLQAVGRIGLRPVLLMTAETVFLALLVLGALALGIW